MWMITFFSKQYKAFRIKRVRKLLGYCHPTAEISYKNLIVGFSKIFMGEYSLIQPEGKYIITGGKLIIGKWVSLSYNVTVITGNHTPTVGFPQHKADKIHLNDSEKDIVIEDDCWIGANATLLSGAKMCRGSVAGASALVNKEIPPYAVVAGIPAKIVAVKFTKEQILEHEEKLYPEEERLKPEYLDELFEKYYQGKKCIGTSDITDEQCERYNNYYHVD